MNRDQPVRVVRFVWLGPSMIALGESGRGWARGYAFAPDGSSLEDDEIARHLFDRRSRLIEAAAELNGSFAAVIDADSAAVLVSDRIGTTPLYVHRSDDAVFAASDPWSVVAALPAQPELDPLGALDLMRTGYVTGRRTLIAGVETLAPATVTRIEGDRVRESRYWRYGYRPEPQEPAEARERLAAVFGRIAERTARHLTQRHERPALTLSGGLDSRVLAAVLTPRLPGPVGALSYGSPDNPELEVAGEVAAEMGMLFRATPVSSDYWNDDFIARSVREVGVTTRFTCGLGARHLDASGFDVLIPGHTGDFVSGGHLPAQVGMVGNRAQLCRYLEFTHFRYLGSEGVMRRILRMDYAATKWRSLEATTSDFDFDEDLLGLIDRWNVENRQRRLILMELRAYEQLGRWMLPFYDHELLDFYATVPHPLRVAQNLYVEAARQNLFSGPARGLADLRRIGSRAMRTDPGLARRIDRLRRLQPFSGWFLQFGLAHYRDLSRRWRPKPEQRFGTDTVKAWFQQDEKLRAYVLDRVEGLEVELIDSRALTETLLAPDVEERVYNRLLPSVLTIRECREHALRVWRRARSESALPRDGSSPAGGPAKAEPAASS